MNKQQATSNKLSLVVIFLFLTIGAILTVNSCTKDSDLQQQDSNASLELRDNRDNVFYADNSTVETKLGSKIPCNPYTVEIVTEAWNNLYPERSVSSLPPSHRYVKFKPASEIQIYELYKDPKLVIWDHPLDHEIEEMGDYYIQPGKGQNEMPDLYSVVDIEYPLATKGVSYQKIEDLVKVPYNTPLSAEAFRLCNLTHIKVTPRPKTEPPLPPPPCSPSDPEWPECLNPPDPPPPDDPDDPVVPQYCECTQYHNGQAIDNWIVQLEEGETCEDHEELGTITGEGIICNSYYPPPPSPSGGLNSCGCPYNYHPLGRKPAGCVKVQAPTGPDYDPVRNGKVLIRNTSCFGCPNTVFDILWTEAAPIENGCWKIDRECYGKIWVWVQFVNENAYVRGHNFNVDISTDPYGTVIESADINGNLLNYIRPVTDYVGEISGPNFSNIEVNYSLWTQEGTQTQRYWCAATTVNAVEEMHKMCSDEGINTPPHMDIYLTSNTANAAWMAHYEGVSNIIWAQLADAIAPGFSMSVLPDIVLDRNNASNRFNRLAYHEFAHASHFTNVSTVWWHHLTHQEFVNGGHGNGSEPDAGYVAVAESWGNHIEALFDLGNPSIYSPNLDRIDFEASNDPSISEWIPDGIYYDLFDDREINLNVLDNVRGVSNSQIFNILNNSTHNIGELETNIWNNYNSNSGINMTQTDLNLLFNSYGF